MEQLFKTAQCIASQRVHQLRLMRGLLQADLADRLAIDRDEICQIESGDLLPSEEVLELLALELGVTSSYLQREQIKRITPHSPALLTIGGADPWRRTIVYWWMNLVAEEYERLATHNRAIPSQLPHVPGLDSIEAAHLVREVLGFTPDEPLPHVVTDAERVGVWVLGLPVWEMGTDAVSGWYGSKPVIGILSGASATHTRLAVARELGRLVMNRTGQCDEESEKQVNEFANEFLMPRAGILPMLPSRPHLSSLAMVKTQWGVDIKTLVQRCRELSVIGSGRASKIYRQLAHHTGREPGFVPLEVPRGFRKLVELCYGHGPNIELMSAESGWSAQTARIVVSQHATADELPRKSRRSPDLGDVSGSNVVSLASRSHHSGVA